MRLQRENLRVSLLHFTLKVTWQLSVVNDRTGRGDRSGIWTLDWFSLSFFQRKNQSVWVGYVDPWSVVLKQSKNSFDNAGQFSLFQRKNLSWQCREVLSFPKNEPVFDGGCAVLSFSKKKLILTVLCGSLFSKERTHLEECCAVLPFPKKELVLTVLCSSLFFKERTGVKGLGIYIQQEIWCMLQNTRVYLSPTRNHDCRDFFTDLCFPKMAN